MGKALTQEDVLRIAQEKKIEFIRLQFTDILGTIKNVSLPVIQLEKALSQGISFDGSSIEGFTRIEESDMILKPDPRTFVTFPWESADEARLICDVYTPNGQPFPGDPRYVLTKAIEEAEELGFTPKIGAECEFFLFHLTEDGAPTTLTHDKGGYFDMGPVDRGERARRSITLALEQMGFEVEPSHHENAPGQHEIDFKYSTALTAADRVSTFKFVTKTVARQHGLHATFMPKPIYGIAGSGMHVNISLFRDSENAFYNHKEPYELDPVAIHFIAGLLAHAKSITAITNPLINSYKRLVAGFEAPVYVSWSASNRSALVRVPAGRKKSTRLELRSPDPSTNPYLAFAVMIKAGLDGIKRKLTPPDAVTCNIYELSQAERNASGIENLPRDLNQALEALTADPLMLETLGEHVFTNFVKAKRLEWEMYQSKVHPWEVETYLPVF